MPLHGRIADKATFISYRDAPALLFRDRQRIPIGDNTLELKQVLKIGSTAFPGAAGGCYCFLTISALTPDVFEIIWV